jgi:hypothetical protein
MTYSVKDNLLEVMMNAPVFYINEILTLMRQEYAAGRLSPYKFQAFRNLNGHDKNGRVRNYDTLVLYHPGLKYNKTCFHLYHPYDNDIFTKITAGIQNEVVTLAVW